jgi:hypothetical protein
MRRARASAGLMQGTLPRALSSLGLAATRKLKSNKTRVSVFAYNTRGVLPSVFEEETVR